MMTTMTFLAMCSVGILTLAVVLTVLLGRVSASFRHLVWTVALGALVAVPVLELSGLRLEVPVPARMGTVAAPLDAPPFPAVVITGQDTDPTDRSRPATVVEHSAHVEGARSEQIASDEDSDAERASVFTGDDARAIGVGMLGVSDVPVRPDWPTLLAIIWAIGTALFVLATLLGHLVARRLTVRGAESASPAVRRRFAKLCVELEIRRPVRLVVSGVVDVPATCGLLRSTVILPRNREAWSSRTLDRVLLHELAHVRRGDCRSYLLGDVARALHWPNPLTWLALRRLRAESERACDDLVLSRGNAPSSYAQDLVSLMRRAKIGHPLPGSVLTMASPSGLGGRVRAILDPERPRRPVGVGHVIFATTLAASVAFAATVLVPVAVAQEGSAGSDVRSASAEPRSTEGPSVVVTARNEPAAPAPPTAQELCVFRSDGPRSTSIHMDGEVTRIRWETDDCRVDVEIEGDVRFLDDDSGVARMARDALFEVEERIGRVSRRARLHGEPTGEMERRYWVDGDEVAWGTEADRWLAQILPELFRQTTINAEARVRRMVAAGGPDRVFAEVAAIRSSHVSAHYFEILMDEVALDDADYARVIEVAGGIDSDHTAGELLFAVIDRAGLRPAFQEPMLRAAESLGSDHQKSRVLEKLLEADLSPTQLNAVVASSQTIESDHNLSMVLVEVARRGRLADLDRGAFLDALATIQSDHATGVVVDAFLDIDALDGVEIMRVLEMAEAIGSDHERATVLGTLVERHDLEPPEVSRFLEVATVMRSDHQTAATLMRLAEAQDLDGGEIAQVLESSRGIGSDHQRASVMMTLAGRYPIEGEALGLYGELAEGLSRSQRDRVLAAVR